LALPEPIQADIVEYWRAHGAVLKSYRDLGQHYLIVGTEARVLLPAEGKPALHFCLPNNPDTRPIRDLRYQDPEVHVQPFVLEQFLSLVEFCHCVLEQLLDPQTTSALVPAIGGRTPVLIGGGLQACLPVELSDLEQCVRRALEELRAHSAAVRRGA
jgi:hypothetical protein